MNNGTIDVNPVGHVGNTISVNDILTLVYLIYVGLIGRLIDRLMS